MSRSLIFMQYMQYMDSMIFEFPNRFFSFPIIPSIRKEKQVAWCNFQFESVQHRVNFRQDEANYSFKSQKSSFNTFIFLNLTQIRIVLSTQAGWNFIVVRLKSKPSLKIGTANCLKKNFVKPHKISTQSDNGQKK